MIIRLVVIEEDGREHQVTGVVSLAGSVLIYTADALYVPYPGTGDLHKTGYLFNDGAWQVPR